jgi:hypothetical protein
MPHPDCSGLYRPSYASCTLRRSDDGCCEISIATGANYFLVTANLGIISSATSFQDSHHTRSIQPESQHEAALSLIHHSVSPPSHLHRLALISVRPQHSKRLGRMVQQRRRRYLQKRSQIFWHHSAATWRIPTCRSWNKT